MAKKTIKKYNGGGANSTPPDKTPFAVRQAAERKKAADQTKFREEQQQKLNEKLKLDHQKKMNELYQKNHKNKLPTLLAPSKKGGTIKSKKR
jgi:hypothetical protein